MTEFNTRLVLEAERTVAGLRSLWVGSGDPPPLDVAKALELAEALEDAANLFLDLSEEISAANIQP